MIQVYAASILGNCMNFLNRRMFRLLLRSVKMRTTSGNPQSEKQLKTGDQKEFKTFFFFFFPFLLPEFKRKEIKNVYSLSCPLRSYTQQGRNEHANSTTVRRKYTFVFYLKGNLCQNEKKTCLKDK